MPDSATDSPVGDRLSLPVELLEWQVHLRRRDPSRLPLLVAILLIAAVSVWALFGHPLPAVIAVVLLIGSTGEYLFPVRYRINETGVYADSLTGRYVLLWKEAKRCTPERQGIVVTSLAVPSRLEPFRGVLLRFAPDGEPGDRTSVLTAIRHYAPHLAQAEGKRPEAEVLNAEESGQADAIPSPARSKEATQER